MGDKTQQDFDSLLHLYTFQCGRLLFLFNPVSSLSQSTSSTQLYILQFKEQVEYTRQPPGLNNSRPLIKSSVEV